MTDLSGLLTDFLTKASSTGSPKPRIASRSASEADLARHQGPPTVATKRCLAARVQKQGALVLAPTALPL